MAAEPVKTWDISPARRPSLQDVGGATLIDDADNPPDAATMPHADQLNQLQYQAEAASRMVSCAAMDIVNSGSPSISRLSAPGTNLVPASFTVTLVGAGHVRIVWTAGALPTSTVNPKVQMTTDAAWCDPIPIPISNGVEIKTRNSAGTLTNGNFTLWIF